MTELALILAAAPCAWGLASGALYMVRHERARWRAARTVLPPLPLAAIDEIPDEWPPRRTVAVWLGDDPPF